MGDAVRILIWADDPLVRTGLAALLADEPGTVTLQAGPEADLAATVSASDIDVILCDAGRGPDAVLDQLASAGLALIPVVALLPDRAAAARSLAAGTRGLLLRTADADTLAAAARAAASGLVVLDAAVADEVLARAPSRGAALVEELSPREAEVLSLMAEGLSNRAIAERLEISEHTVKFHVHTVLGKLGTQSRTEAVVRAARLGVLSL
ncbi:MAG TPA: response regulator transcription factor [bacterium]|nr:response regulator transcription factor [bacterium]